MNRKLILIYMIKNHSYFNQLPTLKLLIILVDALFFGLKDCRQNAEDNTPLKQN